MIHRKKDSTRRQNIDWTQHRLGRRPDEEVAAELDVSVELVSKARKRLGFSKYVAPNQPLKGART